MQKEKKICIRITPRRVVVTVLVAASILNLMIIGAAFQAVYFTATPMLRQIVTTPPLTATVLIPTTARNTFTPTQISTQTATSTATNTITPTNTFTQTSNVTPTLTFTSTFTLTSSPIPCMRQFSWPVHVVQRGDTLFALALVTGSTVPELRLANCLPDDRIYVGEWLFVPHLPTDTPTSTSTPTTPSMVCAEFEDLKSATVFKVGDAFITSGLIVTVEPFVWGDGTPTSGGLVYVDAQKAAGGFGTEIQVNNVSISLNLRTLPSSLSLLFGEYGGNLNINVNGDFRNFENFVEINGLSIGGAKVSVLQGFGNDAGYLQLSGPIKSFAIGGQELWLDNLCLSK